MDRTQILSRVAYYNKLTESFVINNNEGQSVGRLKKEKSWVYFFDLRRYLTYFNRDYRFLFLPGDIRYVPEKPTFVKSRPIGDDNGHSVLLKLNRIRHYRFVDDKKRFEDKKDMVVWRGAGYQPHRQRVIKQYYDHPRCNIGQTKPVAGELWEKGFLSIEEQLNYKFIICPEGNDVATNLKWVMSSNSLCIMARPKYETWFMEGMLQPGIHYAEVKPDYSNLMEVVDYYLQRPKEAMAIISNAQRHVAQFKNRQQEDLIALLVLQKYFVLAKPEPSSALKRL